MEQTMTIKGRKRVSREEIIKVQEKANRKAMTVRRVRTGALIAANVLVSLFVLLPLLYAVSVAFMPPGELFTTEMNLVPRQPYLTSAMGIFLFRQFYKSFPISLYESAKIDGCGNLRFIFRILLPLTKSAIGAMAVYTFINAWNMYMWPLLVTGSNEMRTVQIGISMLNSVDAQSITLMIAGVVMIILPSISIFILGQKQLIRGMFSGAVKG